jgi:hypothetical protein
MKRPLAFATCGFAVGVIVALVVGSIASNNSLSPLVILILWPTALFGLGASGWSDGLIFHFAQLLIVFGGNGVVYGTIAFFLGSIGFAPKEK